MRRFFRRHFKKSEDEDDDAGDPTQFQRITPQATAPGAHVCTPLCEGIASLPPEYHESVIASLAQQLGQTPDNLRVKNLSLNLGSARVAGEPRYVMSEVDERRDIEGNTELARLPLALPTTHRYPPLPRGHARFLRLGGLSSHPLAYLESHPLDRPPSYIAVSYCWDPSSPRRGMFLDGQSFAISETVLEVLNQVQASQTARGSRELVWVDQVCINQDDPAEKLDQIFRMGEIYSNADRVFIWLGPTADRSDFALEHMDRMLGEVAALNAATAQRVDLPPDTAATINDDHGQLYGRLFLRPWFRRLWTVQEALLARRLVVMCGYREVDFDLLAQLAYEVLTYGSLDLIRILGASEKEINDAIIGLLDLRTLRGGGPSAEEMVRGYSIAKFRALVLTSRSRQVTDPRDRVHALMGVAPREVRDHMARAQSSAPPGSQSMWQLYTQFAISMLENDPEWYFLSSAPSVERPAGLPSWVPNLDARPPFASRLTGVSHGFSAGVSPETRPLVYRAVTPEELACRGFRLGTVREMVAQTAFTEANENMKHNDVYGDAAREWEQECMRLCQRVLGLGPEQFPRFHVDILTAKSAAGSDATFGGRSALDAYHLFWQACRMRGTLVDLVREGVTPVPERFRDLPDGVDRLADHALKGWRDGLPVADYAALLEFAGTVKERCAGRPYVSTDTGFLGLGCPATRVGDVVCVVYGATVPYVLRPRPDGAMDFVGDAYIHGAMNGETLSFPSDKPDEIIRIR